MTDRLQGLDAIKAMFARAESENRPAFLPYFPIGYPTLEDSLAVFESMAQVGVDAFEVGVPFSDPLADGAVIQGATQTALENGITVAKSLEAVREMRRRGIDQPILLFSYVNPLVAYGTTRVVQEAKEAGADGFIIPDLPPEEAGMFAECVAQNMALVFFLAPTSNAERIQLVAQVATGFIYVVSVTGITGARTDLPPDLQAFMGRVKAQTDKPLVLGFGISTPQHAQGLKGLVEGFIVGSALVKKAREGVSAVRDLAKSLRDAL